MSRYAECSVAEIERAQRIAKKLCDYWDSLKPPPAKPSDTRKLRNTDFECSLGEVAEQVVGINSRQSANNIEKKALAKLANDPLLKQYWLEMGD